MKYDYEGKMEWCLQGKKKHYDHHKFAWNDLALNLGCFGLCIILQDTVIEFNKILKIVHQDHLFPGIGCLMLNEVSYG